MAIKIILCILFGYAIGSINPSYIIGRVRGFDIRRRGSGNAGASNAIIIMGKSIGIFSAVFDFAKATAAFFLADLIFSGVPFASELAVTFCILGHIYPFYMKFRGGKGLASLGGLVLAVDWRLFLILLTVEAVAVLAFDYICVAPITASILFPVLYGVLGSGGLDILLFANGGWWGAAILAISSVAILSRHVENIKRIHLGAELHFSYLWKRGKTQEDELARIGKTAADRDVDSFE